MVIVTIVDVVELDADVVEVVAVEGGADETLEVRLLPVARAFERNWSKVFPVVGALTAKTIPE